MLGLEPVTLEAYGEFSLETWCAQVGADPEQVSERLQTLPSLLRSWTLEIHDPTNEAPFGWLVLRHPAFDDSTKVILLPRQPNHHLVYDVLLEQGAATHPQLVHASLDDAFIRFLQAAIRYRYRVSPLLPPHPRLRSLSSHLFERARKSL